MRLIIIGFHVLLLLLTGVLAQSPKDTLKVLFVGNSYTYTSNLPHVISAISKKTDTYIDAYKSVKGGAHLSEHWQGKRGLKTVDIIKNGDYDIVVLQEFSMGTINDESDFMEYSKKFAELIRSTGAEPWYFQTWAREKVPQYQEIISTVYSKAAAEFDIDMVPVGDAWDLARNLRPTIELFVSDGTHPSDLGTFLSACVFVKMLTGELPEKITSSLSWHDGRGEEIILMYTDFLDIVFCQKVVEEIFID